MADINVIVLPDGTEYPISDFYLPVAISNPTDGQVLKYDATNHVWYNGDDAEGSSVFYGTSAPTSQLGANGNLYVKYTEGTGGASDTVDALYVKLDGAWCQISTGGGGGTSDYSDLTNKPQINSVELSGNKSLDDLGIQPSEISKTATGSIVTFSDGGDNIPVESFECEIVAQQESGTPTPDNPLLITGFSACDLAGTGKNLFDKNSYVSFEGVYNETNPTIVAQSNHILTFIPCNPNTAYTVSRVRYGVTTWRFNIGYTKEYPSVGVQVYGIAASNSAPSVSVGSRCELTTLTSSDAKYLVIYLTWTSQELLKDVISSTQLEGGSTATAYEPFGTTHKIAFGQTIYGGKLIYANGKWFIRATFGMVDLGSLSWAYTQYGRGRFYASMSSVTPSIKAPLSDSDNINALCSISSRTNLDNLTSVDTDNIFALGTTKNISMRCTTYGTDATTFRSALNGIYLYYELETPVIIPLTSSAKIKTLSGVNNIFSNTGDSTLKYFTNDADGIEELINTSETSAENTTIDDTNLAYEANNVQEAFEKIIKYLTWAEYQALSEEEKNNGTAYFITDVNGDGQNFQPVIYSEEEREIGVWMDGKPLYEKTFVISDLNYSSSGSYKELFTVSDLDILIDVTGRLTNSSKTRQYPIPYITSSKFASVIFEDVAGEGNAKSFFFTSNDTWGDGSLLVNVRYTKTTDVAGSGQWTPQGVPAVHYSTDEQIIGTWIDGKTLYEKTIYKSSIALAMSSVTAVEDLTSLSINNFVGCVMTKFIVDGNINITDGLMGIHYNSTTKYLNAQQRYSDRSITGELSLTIRYTKSS